MPSPQANVAPPAPSGRSRWGRAMALGALLLSNAPLALPAVAYPAGLPSPAPFRSAALSAAQEAQIASGEIVTTFIGLHPVYHLDAYGLVAAPMDKVWAAITSYDAYKDFLPMVVESRLVRRQGNKVWQRLTMRPPFPMHDHWVVNLNQEDRANGRLSFGMDDGNLRMEHGYWKLTPAAGGKTRVHYHITVDPWLDVVPQWLIQLGTGQIMPSVIKGARRRSGAPGG